jgi:hypothetical protein
VFIIFGQGSDFQFFEWNFGLQVSDFFLQSYEQSGLKCQKECLRQFFKHFLCRIQKDINRVQASIQIFCFRAEL